MFHPDGPTLLELAIQALSSTERGYDLLAPKFDLTPFRTPDSLLERVTPVIGEAPVESGLDICSGTGAATRMLQPLCSRQVTGIDFSRGMLKVCRANQPSTGDVVTHLIQGDVLAMPFRRVFDVAVCFGALGHIRDRDQPRFLSQVALCLKPGGRFIFPSAFMPSLWSSGYWLARGFNGVMNVRNSLVRPPFIMHYLRFLLPGVAGTLGRAGFRVDVRDGVFDRPYDRLKLVVATVN